MRRFSCMPQHSYMTAKYAAYATLNCYVMFCFFYNDTATTEIYTLSLHDALPIYRRLSCCGPTQHVEQRRVCRDVQIEDRKSTRLNSSHVSISYAVFCLKKKKEEFKHALSQPRFYA